MPVNRNALIRYRTIDGCLQNRLKKWTLNDLMKACSEVLYELQGIDRVLSRRTIQGDIEMMRSNKLGYEAPIVVVDKKYYTYSEKDYSITNIPFNNQDVQVLTEVSDLLKQFKGFHHFAELDVMVSKLEDKIYTQKTQRSPVIDFERNDHLKGLEWLEVLRKSIVVKKTLGITYQSFKAKEASIFHFSPYLLKAYRNRWFVLGQGHGKKRKLLTLALDRIEGLTESEEDYVENVLIDLSTYYHDVLGVSKSPDQKDCEVIFLVDHENAAYVITKPLHHTQQLIAVQRDGKVFSIKVILNFELERELLGFGSRIKVMSPAILVRQIKDQLLKSLEQYDHEVV